MFATYQSSPQIAAAQSERRPGVRPRDRDEAHRCAGPQAGVFATVLDPTKIKARKRLFMTATPRYFTGRVKQEAKEADWEVASMDDEAKFGPVLHRLTFAQAIEQDLLSDYQVVVVGVTRRRGARPGGARRVRHARRRDDHRRPDARPPDRTAPGDGEARPPPRRQLPLADRPREPLRLVAARDERVAARPPPPDGDALDGSRLREDDRRRARRAPPPTAGPSSGGERGVLTNARCLTEGVDVPTLDGVAFIDPRRSQVDIVQAVGRAIRKAEDKTLGTIVIPVLVDEDADPEEALESSEFDRVWQVVRALRDSRRGSRRGTRRATSRTWATRDHRTASAQDRARPSRAASETPSPAPSTPGWSRHRPRAGSSGSDCSCSASNSAEARPPRRSTSMREDSKSEPGSEDSGP